MVEAESGRVAITVTPTGAHLNPWGTVHGGLTATLLDSCMGLAIQSMLDEGIGSTTLEFKISLVRAITLDTGAIRAEGKVLNCGRRVGTAEGRVTDTNGRLLAHGTTSVSFSRANEVLYRMLSLMSALGQKQTFAVQKSMSAFPRKRTFASV